VPCRRFSIFTWESESANAPEEYDLVFDAREGHEPSEGAIMLGLRVVASQARLPLMVVSALWDEFDGRGPDSGMWWCAGMDAVIKDFEYNGCAIPTGPEDLFPAMRFSGVWIREALYEYNNPIALLPFTALFEVEHGVGVLTDGSKILGTGYMMDVSPYGSG
jgi:hypothetical protein